MCTEIRIDLSGLLRALYVPCSLARKLAAFPTQEKVRNHRSWEVEVSALSRDIQAVAGDVATLRSEIERFRTELRMVFERFIDEQRSGTRPVKQTAD